MKVLLTVLLIFHWASNLSAQKITDIVIRQRGSNVMLNYRLHGVEGRAYTVALYSSHNNFSVPLRLVDGDVGDKRVLPGESKSIEWRTKEELTSFDGDISFEFRVAEASPLFTSIGTSSTKVKRGEEVIITWSGGLKDSLSVEFVRGLSVVQVGKTANSGKIVYVVPNQLKTGKYSVQLRQAGENTTGTAIAIKPRYPLWIKLAPIVLGVTIWQLLPEKTQELFPEPPDLTGGK